MAYGKLANKGRYGDTEIRNVAGRKSHVNKREAGLIDLYGMLGENLVQRRGSGTRNPMTGMPEYHTTWSYSHMKKHADDAWNAKVKPIGQMSLPDAAVYVTTGGMLDTSEENIGSVVNYASFDEGPTAGTTFGGETKAEREAREEKARLANPDPERDFDKAAYAEALTQGTQADYLKNIGIPENKIEYFESNIDMDQLGFAQDTYSTGTQALGLKTGSSLGDIYSQTEQIQRTTGLESSGSLEFAKTKATKGVMGDYLTQQDTLQTQLASSKSGFFQGAAEEFWANLEAQDL